MHRTVPLSILLSAARAMAQEEDAITIARHLRRVYPEALAADVARAVRGSGAV